MNQPVRILYVDDYPLDRELVRDALEKENAGFELVEATSRAEFETLLVLGDYDLVLSDFNILGFEGLQVLEAVHARDANIPVVIVTGTGSEEVAAEAIKRGAADYVIKSPKHIQHLPHTILTVLENKRLQAEHKRAEIALMKSEARYRQIIDTAQEGVWTIDGDNKTTFVNPRMAEMLGYTVPEMTGAFMTNFMDDEWVVVATAKLEMRRRGMKEQHEFKFTRKDGSSIWTLINTNPIIDADGEYQGALAMISDITERKRAEEKIQKQFEHLTALREIDRAITSNFNLHLNLTTLLIHAINQLHVDAAAVLLLDPHSLRLEYVAGLGFHTQAIEKTSLGLEEGYAGRAVINRQLVEISKLGEPDGAGPNKDYLAGEGFVSYYGVPLITRGQVKGVLEVYCRSPFSAWASGDSSTSSEWLDFLNTLAGQAAIAIDNSTLLEGLERSNFELTEAYDATIEGWSRALDLRDRETEGHTRRVTELTLKLTRAFKLSETEMAQVRWGALLHDIGKMGVPDSILLKPGPLTVDEWAIMKKHPTQAFELLAPIRYLRQALDIPHYHHEKWDGSGYPLGLKGEQIPFTARIFAVVDVWDALSSDRPYRAAWSASMVREYIRNMSGIHFDPQVVKVFMQMI
ncbi:MAG TPA: HD domain-containing phosphohydrolase [Anaerolineales bacterium]|jgi:PAS domain S-box-containing protein/putative nucleotidyltransferase with HDIG domain